MHITDLLAVHASAQPSKLAFVYLEDGERLEQRVSFAQLHQQVGSLGVYLLSRRMEGQRVMLLHQNPLAFIIAFLACRYAGVVAVPAYYTKSPKQLARLRAQMLDAGSDVILTTEAIASDLRGVDFLAGVTFLTGLGSADARPPASPPAPRPGADIAFIQYTSGSTSQPKGVIISDQNLLSNQQAIREAFGCDPASIILSWLPFHHDMGLIGNLLHAVYIGCTCVLMAPQHFMQKPQRWLQAISHYRATHSGGPNFAYQHCLDRVADVAALALDLSTWRVAYCGSEPVRKDTADCFCEKFRVAGFRADAFYPCYGLAEATLLVSGARKSSRPAVVFLSPEAAAGSMALADPHHPHARAVVSTGSVAHGMSVRIAGRSHLPVQAELMEGEICIAGPSVSRGYWNRDEQDVFYDWDGTPFLRTGDLGFFWRGELFVHGRIKEMLIFRGKNYYPHDVEQVILDCDEALETNGTVVFSTPVEETIVVLAEVKRSHLRQVDVQYLTGRIVQTVCGLMGAEPTAVVLLPPQTIPRTTSGKLQRVRSRELYARQGFTALATRQKATQNLPGSPAATNQASLVLEKKDYASIRAYLVGIIEQKTGSFPISGDKMDFSEVGIDSLRAMELLNAINRDLALSLNVTILLQHSTLSDLINLLENMLWLKGIGPSDKELSL